MMGSAILPWCSFFSRPVWRRNCTMAELRFPSWLRLRLAQEGMLICFSTLLKGKVRDASASAQRGHKGGSGCSLSSKMSPFFPFLLYHFLSTRTLPFLTIFFCAPSPILRRKRRPSCAPAVKFLL